MNPGENASKERAFELREELRAELLSAGFDRVGFAAASEAPGASRFREWIARDFHGEMRYLARHAERRCLPELVLPGVRTVAIVAIHYPPASGRGHGDSTSRDAEISSYARGTDYHRVFEPRLIRISTKLAKKFSGERFRYYVDTGPVLEKAWAERAGVGWIGKNTCSIDRLEGSYFFLGAILTTLEILPDEPAADHCGACRLCIDACPTAAIVEPYVLDARRCISYLTIEHPGEVSQELEDRMGNLVFGCDICQEVCPWNVTASRASVPELAPRGENISPSLEELANLSPDAFRARFPRSAVRRAKFRGFLRSVLIGIGNSGRAEYLELLDRLSDKKEVREDAVLRASLERARKKLKNRPPGHDRQRGTM